MIVSITFRHGTENKAFRRQINSDCLALAKIVPTITSVRVVFYNEKHHNDSSDLVACHISIRVPHKQHIEICEHQHCDKSAFDWALDRLRTKLSHLKSNHMHYQVNDLQYLHDWGPQ